MCKLSESIERKFVITRINKTHKKIIILDIEPSKKLQRQFDFKILKLEKMIL